MAHLTFDSAWSADADVGVLFLVAVAAVAVLLVSSLWRLFERAGEPGWASLVPIYGQLVLLRIAGMSGWWIVLLVVPYLGVIAALPVCIALARRFGRGVPFGIALWLLPFVFAPILAFGESKCVPLHSVN